MQRLPPPVQARPGDLVWEPGERSPTLCLAYSHTESTHASRGGHAATYATVTGKRGRWSIEESGGLYPRGDAPLWSADASQTR